jgi:hypothetical protein
MSHPQDRMGLLDLDITGRSQAGLTVAAEGEEALA